MTFELDEKETKEFKEWDENHKNTCKYGDPMKQGAIGGRLTFSFTPTSIGCLVKIQCACGEEKDLTNTEGW
jgi:hypothetical protein